MKDLEFMTKFKIDKNAQTLITGGGGDDPGWGDWLKKKKKQDNSENE